MDKEKLLEWLKRLSGIKERLVFGLVVCVLAFRVYQILYGGSGEPVEPQKASPRPIPGIEELPPKVLRPPPPIVEWRPLHRKPTMFEDPGRGSSGGGGDVEEDRMKEFTLDSIQISGGTPMAFIRKKGGGAYFVRVGEVFESDFTVTAIDVGKKTVDVRDSETKKTTTLSVKEKKK